MHIPPKPEHWYGRTVNWLLLLILLPVVLIALPIALLFVLGYWLMDMLKKKLEDKEPLVAILQEPELPKELFQNEQLRLTTIEIDWDADVEQAFDEWIHELGWRDEYEELSLKRLLTQPEIAGLHRQLIGPLCKEWNGGLFLQVFEPTMTSGKPAGTSWLVYLNYSTLTWERVEEVGPAYLEVSSNDPGMLQADCNDGSQLWLRIDALV
ncbi:hypothetical protein DNI29_20760 [Hymenobacter sediminis]|uniref:hypothetical protein n=1 Tax=Hymenobacter sediminis TaxID=2218621 RepID=UPI000DA6A7AF|nr:hypothetical protein [Hymenobacter sediminis]RPD44566.1 hypothetical protein DNI29_20760 [Hymenobacter sediminis]